MSRVYVFLAQGFEEIEALTVVDVMRRSNIEVNSVSIEATREVTGSHNIKVLADCLFSDIDLDGADMIVLPGGIPGTPNLKKHLGLKKAIEKYIEEGKYIAAICAAPEILGEAGFLKGKKATCHPGHEEKLLEAFFVTDNVVVDEKIITSRGMGTAIDFSLKLVEILDCVETVDKVKTGLVYNVE